MLTASADMRLSRSLNIISICSKGIENNFNSLYRFLFNSILKIIVNDTIQTFYYVMLSTTIKYNFATHKKYIF